MLNQRWPQGLGVCMYNGVSVYMGLREQRGKDAHQTSVLMIVGALTMS